MVVYFVLAPLSAFFSGKAVVNPLRPFLACGLCSDSKLANLTEIILHAEHAQPVGIWHMAGVSRVPRGSAALLSAPTEF